MCADKPQKPIAKYGNHITIVTNKNGTSYIANIEAEYRSAHQLINAARVMVNSANAIDDDTQSHYQLMAYIYGAIILSYTSLEATLNEILHLEALKPNSPLSEAERKVFYTIVNEGLEARGRTNTLERYNLLLRIMNKQEMEEDSAPYQAANLVRLLRNKLIHPIPGRVVTLSETNDFDYSTQQDIVKKLRSHLKLGEEATFPSDVLTRVCASWAVNSCEAFLHKFVVSSGINPGFHTGPKRK